MPNKNGYEKRPKPDGWGLWKVIFHMDGKGVIFAPHQPPHLDGLIAWAGSQLLLSGGPPQADDIIEREDELDLPLKSSIIENSEVYHASSLFFEGPVSGDERHIVSRFQVNRADLCADSTISRKSGVFGSKRTKLYPVLCRKMVAWFEGDQGKVAEWLCLIKAIGHRRGAGNGRVLSVEFEKTTEDRCLTWDGQATRYLPHPDGLSEVRARPPYWNNTSRVSCLLPGEMV